MSNGADNASTDSESEEYQNPTLPEELVQLKNEDLIENTVISKQKVLNVLLKLVQAIESSSNEEKTLSELDEELEADLCNLWDISAETEVSKVLIEYGSIEVFDQYIKCFHGVFPRGIEILVGIIGNMSLLDSNICKNILSNESLLKFCTQVLFYDLNDTQTLIQILRLFNTFFLNEENTKKFYSFIEVDEDFISFFNFILDQSLNQDLVDLLIEFLLNLFDFNQNILEKFCLNSNFLQSLLNSMITRNEETKDNNDQDDEKSESITLEMLDSSLKNYFICLQFLSTCEDGVKSLCTINSCLLQTFEIYTHKFFKYFDNTFDSNIYFKNEIFIKNFKCYLSIFNVVFANSCKSYLNLDEKDQCSTSFKSLVSDIIQVCVCFLKQLEKINKTDFELNNYKSVFTLIEDFLRDLEEDEYFKDKATHLKSSIDNYQKLE